ncbi:MAG: hypothetical protein R3Y05_00175 [bacterium]
MIEIRYVDDEFVVKGSMSLGFAGVYKNTHFNNGVIELNIDWDEVVDSVDGVQNNFDDEESAKKYFAKVLSHFYNLMEKRIEENPTIFNNDFLHMVLHDCEGCYLPLWENSNLVVKKYLKDVDLEDESMLEKIFYIDGISVILKKYYDSEQTIDLYELIKNDLPCFNIDAFIKSVKPEILSMSERTLSFQCDDNLDEPLLVGAYGDITANTNIDDWDNF